MNTDDDLHHLHVVKLKLETNGGWGVSRHDIREVGRIRSEHRLAPQRDSEVYSDFVDRLIEILEGSKNGEVEEV